jgi:predicted glycosyltransferase
MKIILYCQHVLGIGHYFRSLEIAKALKRHQVILVTGGPSVEAELPPHVTECKLPGLGMDPDFTELVPSKENLSLSEVQEERRGLLTSLFTKTAPDLFLVELYPFGRKRFGFELLPLLEAIHAEESGQTKVVCSLRDILVEKENQSGYERRVLGQLNRYFDALLVHADPTLVSLEETFESTDEIEIPVVYTGFVAPKPRANAGRELRESLGMGENESLVVASSGGGKVGAPLLRAVLEACSHLADLRRLRLYVFTGPFMADSDVVSLVERSASMSGVQILRFTKDFLTFLAAADLSISMAGYNTCMNILAGGAPSLVWPFAQNREQRLRAGKLASLGALSLLTDDDLEPSRLALSMEDVLNQPRDRAKPTVNLNGAEETARWLEAWCSLEEDTIS